MFRVVFFCDVLKTDHATDFKMITLQVPLVENPSPMYDHVAFLMRKPAGLSVSRGYRIVAIMSASQALETGSIPVTRSIPLHVTRRGTEPM